MYIYYSLPLDLLLSTIVITVVIRDLQNHQIFMYGFLQIFVFHIGSVILNCTFFNPDLKSVTKKDHKEYASVIDGYVPEMISRTVDDARSAMCFKFNNF